MTIKVVIVDDQAMVRAGFGALLQAQEDIEVVGDAGNGQDGILTVRETKPDVVLMDVRMPVLDGLQAAKQILGSRADDEETPRVIMLTTFDIDDYVYEALKVGASGFLLKDAPPADLVAAVRLVAAGEALLAPTVTRRLIAEFVRLQARNAKPSVSSKAIDDLTSREKEVLGLIGRGLSNQEIADELVTSEQTVKTHIGRIFNKLGLRDRAQAVVFAYENGIVQPGG